MGQHLLVVLWWGQLMDFQESQWDFQLWELHLWGSCLVILVSQLDCLCWVLGCWGPSLWAQLWLAMPRDFLGSLWGFLLLVHLLLVQKCWDWSWESQE